MQNFLSTESKSLSLVPDFVSQSGTNGLAFSQIEKLRKKFGANELEHDNVLLPLQLFVKQFLSPLVFILLVASGVAIAAGLIKDAYLILSILVLNAFLGFWQEYRAEKALSALKKITVAKTRVIRGGKELEVANRELVPGDLCLLFEGQTVPADAYLLSGYALEVNESGLTGESLPVAKLGGDEEASNIFMGTTITSGNARAVVVATGMKTRFGKIAQALKKVKDEPTPFQKSIYRLSKVLAATAVAAAIVVYLAGLLRGLPIFEVFLVAASLAVAAVPEGLPAIVGLTLAIGVQRMARQYAVVRKMSAVEALGAVTVICTDKTGTLTSGQMRVRYIRVASGIYSLSTLRGQALDQSLLSLLRVAVLANNSTLVTKEDGGLDYGILGTPTDGSLLLAAAELGQYQDIKNSGRVIEDYALDKTTKLISSVVVLGDDIWAFVRGAPEKVLSVCRVELGKNGLEVISEQAREGLTAEFNDFAAKGYRVIGFASKKVGIRGGERLAKNFTRKDIERDLTYLGFTAIADPPRPEVKVSMKKALHAGVRTVMLTGDSLLTAQAIGHEIGLLEQGDEQILGEQIGELTDAELDVFVHRVKIVARATPEQKLRVIQSLQRRGEIVAVTGDGVNDSLALKQADVGVAMGITGTDVAKQASDIILTDDQYSTIIAAIEEGRRIDDNLTKVVRYLVAGNFSEILTVVVAVALGLTTPLLPVQILWVNVVTDALPAFALAVGDGDSRSMHRGPKDKGYHPLNRQGLKWVSLAAIIVAGVTLTGFGLFLERGIDAARTVAFTVLVVSQMVLALIIAYLHRGQSFSWRANRWLIFAIAATVAVQLLFLFIPSLRDTFHLKLP